MPVTGAALNDNCYIRHSIKIYYFEYISYKKSKMQHGLYPEGAIPGIPVLELGFPVERGPVMRAPSPTR